VKPQNETPLSPAPAGDAYSQSSLQLENRRFTYKELEMITSNFQRVLGRGGFGSVYDGFLEDGTQVAVKLRSDSSNQGVKEFLAEVGFRSSDGDGSSCFQFQVEICIRKPDLQRKLTCHDCCYIQAQTLTRIHHKNLVSMIGYCKDGDYMALVYEYMSEGTLQEHIAGTQSCLVVEH
jgi:serine/threonine protein kinase